MRYLLILVVVLASSFVRADMVNVSITSTFTAQGMWFASTCEGCTQNFKISFQYDPSLIGPIVTTPPSNAYDLLIESNGFLGTFTSVGMIHSDIPPYIPFLNQWGDEVDVEFNSTGVTGLSIFGCVSSSCTGAYGIPPIQGLIIRPTQETVTVPEPWSALFVVTSFAVFTFARRRSLPGA